MRAHKLMKGKEKEREINSKKKGEKGTFKVELIFATKNLLVQKESVQICRILKVSS